MVVSLSVTFKELSGVRHEQACQISFTIRGKLFNLIRSLSTSLSTELYRVCGRFTLLFTSHISSKSIYDDTGSSNRELTRETLTILKVCEQAYNLDAPVDLVKCVGVCSLAKI